MRSLCLLLLCCHALLALDGPSVDMWVDDTRVDVGDRIDVSIRYRWPQGWQPEHQPDPGTVFNAAGAFVVDLPAAQELRDGEAEQRLFTIGVLATRSGSWQLPQPGLQVSDPQGQVHSATAPVVVIDVGVETAAIDLGEASELWMTADDPDAEATLLWPWIILALAILVIVVLSLSRRRHEHASLSPAERFQQDLRMVRAAADGKLASALLSQALRRYTGSCCGIDALGATTRELRGLLGEHYDSDTRRELLAILEELDAWRWAPDALDSERIAPLQERAASWIAARERAATESNSDKAA